MVINIRDWGWVRLGDWNLALGLGIGIRDRGLRIGLILWDLDWELILEIRIRI